MTLVPSSLAVLRTPLLPVEELARWSADLRVAGADDLDAAVTHDRALLRERLRAIVARPEITEALFLASPDLIESLGHWQRDPESKKGRRAEHGLVRYFARMAARPTPFGLFSGCTAGEVRDGATELTVAGQDAYRRHSRLDMDYLFALCEELASRRDVRASLTYRPNSSLYESGGRYRFAEARVHGRTRTYHLVAVDPFDALRDTLARAADGARIEDLAAALVADDPEGEVTFDDAEAFVHDLIDNQLLVAELAPPVTGTESASAIAAQLAHIAAARDAHHALVHAEAELAAIDREGRGHAAARYRALADALAPAGIGVELARLVQVDLIKPAQRVTLGRDMTDEIARGVELLHRFMPARTQGSLEAFRDAFVERYGDGREVPLVDALDEESGIGFERSHRAGAEGSPLLTGLPFVAEEEAARVRWTRAEDTLLRMLLDATARGATEVELTAEIVAQLEEPRREPLPDALHATVTIAAASPESLARGEFRVLLHSAVGPSGARMLGRFCHIDRAIHDGVAEHLAAEESLAPDAVFAEIVHLPAGRLGNILARPVLRNYEIPFLGRSGAPRERQLPLDDLMVRVDGDRIRLRSRRLDREIVPRLTTAHNTTRESIGAYRFLVALQESTGVEWSWGAFESAPFLPRVTCGRLVVSRARWRIAHDELAPLIDATGGARMREVLQLRERRRLPRYCVLADGDNELVVDFDNVLLVDAFLDVVRNRGEILVMELYPPFDELCASGPEGRFVHELVLPFIRNAQRAAMPMPRSTGGVARTFVPGSEWLYAKLYTGTATADRLLREDVAAFADEALASGAATQWFFLRYSDPHWHLRIRVRGDVRRLQPQLEALFARAVANGSAWKCTLDTYDREVERYGGAAGIELAERLFFHDSEAVIALLDACSGDAGADLRWRLLLHGTDAMLDDFRFDVAAKLRFAEAARDGFAMRYRYDALRDPIAERLRSERTALQRMLSDPAAMPAALSRRSRAFEPIVEELFARERRGELTSPVASIVPSFMHMFANRLSRSAGPEHELVAYDYLVQLYRSQLARASVREGRRVVGVAGGVPRSTSGYLGVPRG